MVDYFSFFIVFLSSFASSYIILPFFIHRMHMRRIVGRDMNKLSHPEVAEMGGTAVLLGFVFSVMMALFFHSHLSQFPALDLVALLAAMLTIVLVGLLGIIDDLIGWKKGIRQYQHALIPIFAALPLVVLPQTIGNTGVDVPFFHFFNFGIYYSIILVPLAVTGASNAANMIAGLNGLEAGMGLLNALAILIVGLVLGEVGVVILMLGLMGALLAFLFFNWTPAKIFPGDSLTLMMGAGIASASIIGNMEKVGLMLFFLYFIELFLKARTKMQSESFGVVQTDGTLKSPEKIGSLTHVVMRMGKFTEKQVVLIILGMQGVVVLVTLLVFWLNFTQTTALGLAGGFI
jgi:UDP-N-acetylglucosamine--dolichyl-phosphate N-acetylglucosaminephosphotransferase